MRGPFAARKDDKGDLFAQIGTFLASHALSPEPAHYNFAYDVIANPDGPIAQAVARLTDGGVRLSRSDIEKLGGTVVMGGGAVSSPPPRHEQREAVQLVAETQAQVDGFADMMRAMQDETRGFGRDLAQSAAAIERSTPVSQAAAGLDEIARITGSMLSRIRDAETRLARATQESLSELTAITQETLSVSGILLSKSFTRQQNEIDRYAEENRNQVRLQVSQQMSGQWFFATVNIFLSIIPAVIYVAAAYLITGGVEVTAGTIVAFTTVQARLMFPLLGLLRVALDLQTSSALFARIFEYLDLIPAITNKPDAHAVRPAQLGRVEFDDVVFRYPDAPEDSPATLKGVSLVIEPGQFAAFVGPSGAGKTTVSYLIPRLHDVTSGRVLFAGDDVRDIESDSLVRNIGIVSQETYLFHATIGDNLRYAKPDAELDELKTAAKGANIHDTIMSFPDGYDTVVGERGYRLSGGEKQRIAIARVLLKDPAVLILDEATSALDSISERVVQDALDAASRGRTTIAVAHRLSTVISADVIFVVVGGRIVESGTHEQLLSNGGMYSSLYAQQLR